MFTRRKIRFIKQHDSMQCGLASLAMAASWWGRYVSIESLEEKCSAGPDGINLLNIKKCAEAIGMKATGVLADPTQLNDLELPAILHWRQNHFVLLYRITKKVYYIADPAKGLTVVSDEDFKAAWISTDDNRGIALLLKPEKKFYEYRETAQTRPRQILEFISKYVSKYKTYLMHIVLGLLIGCGLQILLPLLTQAIVDRGIHDSNINFIWLVLIGEFLIIVGNSAVDFMRRWILLHISIRVNLNMLGEFFVKLFRLPMIFFESRQLGDLLQRIGDHGRVQNFLTSQMLSTIFSIISLIVLSGVMMSYSLPVLCIYVIATSVYVGWICFFLHRRKILDYEVFESQVKSQNCTYRMISMMREIKQQCCIPRRHKEWEDTQADIFQVQLRVQKLQQIQEAGAIFINEFKNILITVVAAGAVIDGNLTLGAMLAIQYIIGQMNSPVSQLMGFMHSVQDMKISLERIFEIQKRPNEDNENRTIKNASGDIVLDHVTFRYDKFSPVNAIDNISLHIPENKITTIVGASGSGKTTLVKLILGYYETAEGQITIGGTPIESLDLNSWREMCGTVMQDGALFSDTIARNIATSDDAADHERVVAAAQVACIDDYIEGLPMKYNTIIGPDGRGVSQGQQQRILIARSLYRQSPYIIFDEATNSLDAENERKIVSNLKSVFANKTVIIVAHRLSTVQNADNIVVMDGGKIVEEGTHEVLVAKRGYYYNLIKNQLELGQ